MKLSDLFRQLRGRIPQATLADRSSLSRTTISNIENGIPISYPTLRALSDGLNLSPDDWSRLLILWLRETLGTVDFENLRRRLGGPALPNQQPSADDMALAELISGLTERDKQEIRRLLNRPALLAVIRALNEI